METYRRKPCGRRKAELVQAIQVERPLRKVTYAFPRTRQLNKPSGALDYIRVIDAPAPDNRARLGDWIIKHSDGSVGVVSQEEFAASYEPHTGAVEAEIGTPDQAGEAVD